MQLLITLLVTTTAAAAVAFECYECYNDGKTDLCKNAATRTCSDRALGCVSVRLNDGQEAYGCLHSDNTFSASVLESGKIYITMTAFFLLSKVADRKTGRQRSHVKVPGTDEMVTFTHCDTSYCNKPVNNAGSIMTNLLMITSSVLIGRLARLI